MKIVLSILALLFNSMAFADISTAAPCSFTGNFYIYFVGETSDFPLHRNVTVTFDQSSESTDFPAATKSSSTQSTMSGAVSYWGFSGVEGKVHVRLESPGFAALEDVLDCQAGYDAYGIITSYTFKPNGR